MVQLFKNNRNWGQIMLYDDRVEVSELCNTSRDLVAISVQGDSKLSVNF
jgi:hypothetical protein